MDVKLSPGNGFHLKENGNWEVRKIPNDIIDISKFSGYLTINGYKSVVFDAPGGETWAQKQDEKPMEIELTPDIASEKLRSLSFYIDGLKRPSKSLVSSYLNKLIKELNSVK